MSGSGRRVRSRGELIRQRSRAQFVGRSAQLSLFTDNLAKDPESETDPAEFLFHVRGVGGVGKSSLLRQWQEAARRAGAVTAIVDENDVHGVPQALTELARQLAEQGGPLKEFDKAAEQHRREQETAAAEPLQVDGPGVAGAEASTSSRVVTQAALGAASLIPGVGVVTAMANPDVAAQGLDRLRAGARSRGRRVRGADATGLSRAFVSELGRLSARHPWVVLFLDTWEQTRRFLDGWLRDLLDDGFGPLPVDVIVVLAGRDELAERDWAPLRTLVADVPLEVFTEAETRTLLAARGVTEPEVVDAVWQLSMGLPLLVDLLALARPRAAEDVGAEVMDDVVERFVQWITDPRQRETVLACALATQLNEDVFAAAAPPEAGDLWGWLCEQPFVNGRGDFKQYHAVVRASMVRQQRTHSPRRWTAAHLRLAGTHAVWREAAERDLPAGRRRWSDPRWRRHRLDEVYHRLCAHPAGELTAALEEAVHAAGRNAEALEQWVGTLEQAARDTADRELFVWADRLRGTTADEEPLLACLTALLTHARLGDEARAWAYTYRGRHLFLAAREAEAVVALDRAVELAPDNAVAWAYRGDAHSWLDHPEEALRDLTTAVTLRPEETWILAHRGAALREAGRYDEAVADLTTALAHDPADAWALTHRGETYRRAGRYDEAIADLTAAVDRDPTDAWPVSERGETYRRAGRYDEAVADFTTALALVPEPVPVRLVAHRGLAHHQAGRYEEAIADLTAALDLDPGHAFTLAQRGDAFREAGRYDESVADYTAALAVEPDYAYALAQRGEAHRLAERYDEAVADFTASLALDPADAWTLGSRGQAHQGAGRADRAVADLTAALALDPALDWALVARALAHQEAERYEEAVADLTAALALDPADAWALARRGFIQRLRGRYDEAVADLTAALALDPTLVDAHAQRGVAFRQTERYDESVADFTSALALVPDFAWALAQRGETRLHAGRFDEAVADFTAALDLDGSLVWALAERGEAHRNAGRYERAVADFTAALDADPTLGLALAQRGVAHRQAGRYAEAVADFTAALDVEPGEPWHLAQRGVAHREAGSLAPAREDIEAAVAARPADLGYLFEKAVLDTLESGAAACAEQWRELLGRPVEGRWGDATRFFGLFRVLVLEPEGDPAGAVEAFLAAGPDHDAVTDLLCYLAELSASGDRLGERARACRALLLARRPAPPAGLAGGG
ncbi:tetratricopeptide repeat protein [Streptomyces sp. NPDC008121]|uniref:tetratricopeptide repeat protein n=1 Tax=Streptomyces sp. NPDC008121 TaxID=3364809 RepID=UPI0036EE5196